MFERIKNCICHPRLLGLYYKDSILKAIAALVGLFAFFMLFSVIIALNTNHLTYDDTKVVTNLILYSDECDVKYDGRTCSLSGTSAKFEGESYIVDFLSTENYSASNKMVFRFNAKNMDFIYSGYVVGTYTYSDYSIDDFSISRVQSGDITSTMQFQALLFEIFSDINPSYSAVVIANDAVVCLGYYLIVFVISLVVSFFINGDIQGKVRAKLCIYSTLIYFLVMIIAIIYSAQWLQYVALCLPFIYTNITFSRIIRVKKPVE